MNLFSAAVGLALVSYAGSGVFAPPASHLSGPQSHVQLAYDVEKYWVFCINEKTSVEMWDLEQMHVRYGSDVCQLYENTSMSSAQNWMAKNFPSGTCTCE